jgi:hypothetical protein
MVMGESIEQEIGMSRTINGVLSGLAAGVLAVSAAGLNAATKKSLDETLAEHGYRAGEAVEQVPGFRLDGWKAVDSKHLIVFGEASQGYLVTFEYRCYGLGGNPLTVRTRAPGVLAPRDEFQVRHGGRRADHCNVDALHRLEAIPGG